MNYSLFGAMCAIGPNQRKRSESASVRPCRNRCVAPLFALKKGTLRTFRHEEKCFKCDIIHERPTNVCILPGFWTCGVFYNTSSVIKIKC